MAFASTAWNTAPTNTAQPTTGFGGFCGNTFGAAKTGWGTTATVQQVMQVPLVLGSNVFSQQQASMQAEDSRLLALQQQFMPGQNLLNQQFSATFYVPKKAAVVGGTTSFGAFGASKAADPTAQQQFNNYQLTQLQPVAVTKVKDLTERQSAVQADAKNLSQQITQIGQRATQLQQSQVQILKELQKLTNTQNMLRGMLLQRSRPEYAFDQALQQFQHQLRSIESGFQSFVGQQLKIDSTTRQIVDETSVILGQLLAE